MKAIKLILLSAVVALFVVSCDSPTVPEFKTQEVTLDELSETPGFIWFRPSYNIYDSEPSIIKQIKETVKPEDTFYFFAMPTCDCKFNQYFFPYAVKVLTDAGIPANQYKLIALKDKDANHPYSDFIKLNDLPDIFLVRNNKVVYSIGDTVKLRGNDSAYIKQGLHRIEQVILEAISK